MAPPAAEEGGSEGVRQHTAPAPSRCLASRLFGSSRGTLVERYCQKCLPAILAVTGLSMVIDMTGLIKPSSLMWRILDAELILMVPMVYLLLDTAVLKRLSQLIGFWYHQYMFTCTQQECF